MRGMTSLFEQLGIPNWKEHADQIQHSDQKQLTIRNPEHGNIHSCTDTRRSYHQMPLTTKTTTGGRTSTTYTPFTLQDTLMIKSQLPDINKGGAPWIKVFLETCAGVIPALGDFRRVFASCTSLGMLKEVEQQCGTDADSDNIPLHQVVDQLWPAIREKFPIQMKSAELCRIPPNDSERGAAYLLRVRELWQDRTGEDPATSEIIEMLFRGAVEASLPPTVQTSLKNVVGLSSMAYTVWAAHVTQYIDNELEQQEQEKKDLATLQVQLVKSQLKEMRDKVNEAKAFAKQMAQQSQPQQPPPAPPQARPPMSSHHPPMPYGPY